MNPIIGLEGLVTAKLLTDDATDLEYDTIAAIEGLVDVQLEDASADSEPIHADNVEKFRVYKEARVKLTIELLATSIGTLAGFYGHTVTGNELIKKDTDEAPYRAFGFRADDGSGGQDGIWLKKCIPVDRTNSMTYHTKDGDNTTVQTVKVEFEAVPTIHDGEYMHQTNSTEAEMAEDAFDEWFDAVPGDTGE